MQPAVDFSRLDCAALDFRADRKMVRCDARERRAMHGESPQKPPRLDPDAIERQLAHKGQGVRAIYNLAKHMPERKKMMQAWADYLDVCKTMGTDRHIDSKAA